MSLPPIHSASYLLEHRKPHPKSLIEGYLHVGTKEMLSGCSKSYKTWMQIDRAISIASGTPWMGMVTTKARVLFMNMEILEPFFMDRIEEVCTAKSVKPADLSLDIWHLRGYTEGYDTFLTKIAEGLTTVTKTAGSPYEFVVIDPIYKVYGDVDENKASDVAKLLNGIEKFSQKQNAAMSFSAHFAKGPQHEKYAIDRASGSGVFSRDPDTLTTVTRHKEPGCFVVDFTLRNCREKAAFVVEWQYPLMHLREDLDPTVLSQPGKQASSGVKDDEVRLLLPEEGLISSEWQKLVLEETGLKERAFHKRKKSLLADGLIRQDGKLWKPVKPSDRLDDVIL